MKFNILYIIIPLTIGACIYIVRDLMGQSEKTFFATAESEARTLNFEHSVMLQELRIVAGQAVKKGDTLAILFRSELDRNLTENLTQISQFETEAQAKNTTLDKDKEVLLARQAALESRLQAEIKILRTEDSLQNTLKNAIFPQTQSRISIRQEQIAALQQQINQEKKQIIEQIQQLEAQKKANSTIAVSKVAQVKNSINFVALDKTKLALIAPIDGYVEQIFVTNNTMIPQYKDIVKINPKKPNRVIGFIHESSVIPFNIGDSVSLSSFTRPELNTRGIISGCSPQLVELPLRLRRFAEMRAWGRAIYIEMPDTNRFYIGEKLTISLKTLPR